MAELQRTVRDALIDALRRAADYNPEVEVPPCAVMWPDPAHEWKALVPTLQGQLRVLTLGPYVPDGHRGPAVWVLWALRNQLPVADGAYPPVIYLPGVALRFLSDVALCPTHLRPLAGLLHRTATWLQPDGREWTAPEFFRRRECGLGLQLKPGVHTETALRAALPYLSEVSLTQLEELSPLRAGDFEALADTSSDPDAEAVRALIAGGESDQVEFKATARWSTRGNVADVKSEAIVVKTVGAFLNSTLGGTLLIGVEDNGGIHGLDEDYEVTKKGLRSNQDPRDGYILWLGNMLLGAFGKEFSFCLRVTVHKLDDKDVCRVVVDPAPWPAFAGKEELFYARFGNSSEPLSPKAATEYIRKRWGA